VVATANVGHLSALTNAVLWSDIRFRLPTFIEKEI
jgi:hypothetical protein